jgi:hypothetical protein
MPTTFLKNQKVPVVLYPVLCGLSFFCFLSTYGTLSKVLNKVIYIFNLLDFARVEVGPENPIMVERDETAELKCEVDSKPPVTEVRYPN